MAKDDERPLALLGQMHAYSVALDEEMADRVHMVFPTEMRSRSDTRSGGRAGGNRLDPPHDVQFLQPAFGLQEVTDFHHGAMDDRIGDGGAE